ncbi:MAG: TetR family transcriptional regulator [Roseibaca calidilacus]|uniref:TetR family transcriptional regulator n=1 Tax=Roseibaca calidilacus TaxID=1666912 RepID=A0A0P7WLT7_9RHOB|nr:TetR/AcrR family transcriptional regulator [Roseibaca calidilacus]KPP91799.1 MAG: TetR family transcriptional regulator [Roseibaca calidilacus]CUX82496.1 transcriptional regulator, TetR family [Roseibaca calidilacus]
METADTAAVEAEKTTGWRGSRALWLDAARRALLDSGLEAVKIQPLASDLNLSRTSFYWFFKDRQALLDALLDDWEARNTGAFVLARDAYAETIAEAILNLIAVFYDPDLFDPNLDFAVRAWGQGTDAVKARVTAADAARLGAIRAMFERFGFAAAEADVRARTVYLTQIGYISMQVREDMATRLSRVPDYVRAFSGTSATETELARFHARLKFAPAG